VSHNKERAEKVCLNCRADLIGRYCHVCGQENLEPKESLWHLITHYAYDITHFDGKFFATLKYLLIKPGHLPAEYLKGKRASYLHPIKMYVFTSAFFFIIVFSMFHLEDINVGGRTKQALDSLKKIDLQQQALKNVKTKRDSAVIMTALGPLTGHFSQPAEDSSKNRKADSSVNKKRKKKTWGRNDMVEYSNEEVDYKTVAAYDSAQKALPEDKRDSWLERRINRRNAEVYEKYEGDIGAILDAWLKKFTHTMPQLLFVSLPLFSFVLWLLYIRRKKEFFYTGHIIFSLYLYIFYFIAYPLFFGLQKLRTGTGWGIWRWVELALLIYMLYYMYKAMRNFYRQRRFKTFVKLMLLSFASFFVIIFLFVLFTLFSVFTM